MWPWNWPIGLKSSGLGLGLEGHGLGLGLCLWILALTTTLLHRSIGLGCDSNCQFKIHKFGCTTWLMAPKAINASILLPRMILSVSYKSVVQLVNYTDKPMAVKPGLALWTELGSSLNKLGDNTCHASENDGDCLFNIGRVRIFDTSSTCQFTLHGVPSAPIDTDCDADLLRAQFPVMTV